MDAVIRGLVIYLTLLILFGATGKRTVTRASTFDFVLLLIVAERRSRRCWARISRSLAPRCSLALSSADRLANCVSFSFPRADRIAESAPVVLVHEGVPMEDRMRKAHINTEGSSMQRDTRTARTHGPDPLRDPGEVRRYQRPAVERGLLTTAPAIDERPSTPAGRRWPMGLKQTGSYACMVSLGGGRAAVPLPP